MALKATGIVKQLGWRGFFQLIAHLPSFLKLFLRLIEDRARTPDVQTTPRWTTLAYVVLPADLVPDFLIGVGQLDDFAVILGGLRLFLSLCPPQVVQEHLRAISGQ